MQFGALDPLPNRLGGGWTAEQHARVVADVVASMRTAPLGVMLISACKPTAYFGRNGNGVATFDGGTTYVLGGNLTATFAGGPSGILIALGSTWIDEVGGEWPVNVSGADIIPLGASAAVTSITWTGSQVIFLGAGTTDSYVAIIYTDDVTRTIDQYGGDLDKRNSETEGETPCAWGWLLEMRNSRGSAYATDGLVDVENIAWARMFGFCQRMSEQEAAAQDPASATGGRLAQWAQWLGIATLSTDSEATTRAKAIAKKRLKLGAVESNLIPTIQAILGSAYVDIFRDVGTFTSPPAPTYWSEVTIPSGVTAAFSLGTGGGTVANDEPVWMSRRFWPTIIVQVPANKTVQDVANTCEGQLLPLLHDLIPSVSDVEWGRLDSNDTDDGFILDQSLLDFDLL